MSEKRGTYSDDYLLGDDTAERFLGLDGDDEIYAGGGNDTIFGGNQNDLLHGDAGNDRLTGGNGADSLYGGEGNDNLYGGNGNDVLVGGGGVDRLNGGDGDDHLTINDASGLTGINGGSGNDYLYGSVAGYGQIHMRGDDGDDTIVMDLENRYGWQGHHVYGGRGSDIFVLQGSANIQTPVLGRIDDFDYTRDSLQIDDVEIDLMDPASYPDGVAVVSYLGQQWLRIEDKALYALEGARDSGFETHFQPLPDDLMALPEVKFVDTRSVVPEWVDTSDATFIETSVDFAEFAEIEDDPEALAAVMHIHGTDGADLVDDLTIQVGHVHGSGSMHGSEMSGMGGSDMHDHGAGGMDHTSVATQTFHIGGGDDIVGAGKGHDTVFAGTGNDTIAGGVDDDVLYGEEGRDLLYGGSENDELHGGFGRDTLVGGNGKDTLFGGIQADRLVGERGDDVIRGSWGNDYGHGGLGDDFLAGGQGNDKLIGGGGSDTINGGSQNDTLAGWGGNDTLDGGSGNDVLSGHKGDDTLDGGWGNDMLFGGGGNDVIIGGKGSDSLTGGAGEDEFVIMLKPSVERAEAETETSVIKDLELGEDTIRFVLEDEGVEVDINSLFLSQEESSVRILAGSMEIEIENTDLDEFADYLGLS